MNASSLALVRLNFAANYRIVTETKCTVLEVFSDVVIGPGIIQAFQKGI